MTSDESYALKWAKKSICANRLGGRCKVCNTNDVVVLQFHHVNPSTKEFDISQFKSKSLHKLLEEVDKCELLCANHHLEKEQELRDGNKCLRRQNVKKALLEYKQTKSCEACNYIGVNFSSLQFHHINPAKKTMKVIQEAYMHGLTNRVCNELDECKVICANCHAKEHTDLKRLSKLKSLIDFKIKNHQPKEKIPHSRIINLFKGGMQPMDIVRHLRIRHKQNVYRVLEPFRR